jgi:hypothetical protein
MARIALLLLVAAGSVHALQAETAYHPAAAEIMARVAENQDRAVEQRKEFVYHQTARVRLLKTNGKLVWDETREYNVTPTPAGTESQLVRTYGERRKDRDYKSFDLPGELDHEGLDPELVDSFHDELTAKDSNRDGLSHNFFPLTSAEQKYYRFTLDGEESYRRRQVYRVRFEPEPDSDERVWKGEVLVDKEEFQPVFVATKLALKIPAAIRVLFGINIRQIGFSVSYDRFGENVWFPVSYGGEFSLKLFHFYKRTVIVSMVNQNFRRATVASDIHFAQPVEP